jgi:hypothetical protein
MSVRDALNAATDKIADNVGYVSEGSVTKAKLFKEGVMTLLTLRASLQERGGSSTEAVRFDQQALNTMLADVNNFLSSNRKGSGTSRMNMRCYRG